MENLDELFTADEIEAISIRAVNELIADAESGHVRQNRELAEAVAGCIRKTRLEQLQTLNSLLNQRALERLLHEFDRR